MRNPRNYTQDQKEVNTHRTSHFFLKYFIQKKQKAHLSNHLYQCSSDDEQSLQLAEIRTRPGPSSPEPLADARGKDDNKAGRREENPIEEMSYFEGQFS